MGLPHLPPPPRLVSALLFPGAELPHDDMGGGLPLGLRPAPTLPNGQGPAPLQAAARAQHQGPGQNGFTLSSLPREDGASETEQRGPRHLKARNGVSVMCPISSSDRNNLKPV